LPHAFGVEGDIRPPLGRHIFIAINGGHWAFRHAGGTADARIRVDKKHVVSFIETLTGADDDTIGVLAAPARLSYDKSHVRLLNLMNGNGLHPLDANRARWLAKLLAKMMASVEETSAELLERHRQGDARATEALFARYVERLTEMVRWQIAPRLRRRLDPEDAVHSAYRSFFARASQGRFVLERSGDLWKLLVTITLNKLRRQIAHHDAGKRAVRAQRSLHEAMSIDAAGPSPLEALAAADQLEALMAQLSPLQRHVLELRLQECSWDEIAAATGRSERTVRRALEEVRRAWHSELPADSGPLNLTARIVGAGGSRCAGADPPVATFDYRDFVLNEMIGSGGMGKVYRARQGSLQRQVAVKMLRKSSWASPGAIERFIDEARLVSQLHHPGIVGVHGVGRTPGGGCFIVMDFIEGANLAEAIRSDRPSPHQATSWVAEAATAIDYAHRCGVVHCDIKPSNILRANDGRIVVTDFGLATSLAGGASPRPWAGTPGFMAPEQLDNAFGAIGPATDIFALGLVLHHLLTGRSIFEGKRILQVLGDGAEHNDDWAGARSESEVPVELANVLARCLALTPEARFASARELSSALRALAK
jgi:eukaryotic-like serine/threonine-protein kinase